MSVAVQTKQNYIHITFTYVRFNCLDLDVRCTQITNDNTKNGKENSARTIKKKTTYTQNGSKHFFSVFASFSSYLLSFGGYKCIYLNPSLRLFDFHPSSVYVGFSECREHRAVHKWFAIQTLHDDQPANDTVTNNNNNRLTERGFSFRHIHIILHFTISFYGFRPYPY